MANTITKAEEKTKFLYSRVHADINVIVDYVCVSLSLVMYIVCVESLIILSFGIVFDYIHTVCRLKFIILYVFWIIKNKKKRKATECHLV